MYMSIIQLDQLHLIMNKANQHNEETVHKILLESLGNKSRIESQLLYRKDRDALCVYSNMPLNQDKLLVHGYIVRNVMEIGELYHKIDNGDVVKIFIRTVPSKKIQHVGRKNSARISLFKKADRVRWIERKLSESGVIVMKDPYQCPLIIENGATHIAFQHSNHQKSKGDCKLTAYDYIATVRIQDKELFINNVKNGIGPYKSYGCGLILIGAV